MKRALFCGHLIVCNLTLFSSFLSNGSTMLPPCDSDMCTGMIAVLIVGYRDGEWIARFPFGHHWGERGYAAIPFEYFDRFNRDRWIIEVERCGNVEDERAGADQLGLHLSGHTSATSVPPSPHVSSQHRACDTGQEWGISHLSLIHI